MSKSKPTDAAKPAPDKDKKDKPADGGWRETVESIAMAVILALLFRGFVAEAFVIPTGSMAPTLQGRHKDVECPKCHYWYQTSASDERREDALTGQHVTTTTCPICRYTQTLDLFGQPNDHSFSGDRIIVGKFCYDLGDPQRFDVIVFKFPGNAVQNYIKRLIGLPNERLRIAGGNIYTCGIDQPDEAFRIARKPPHKLDAMLQIVDDADYIPEELTKIGWPLRWQEWIGRQDKATPAWKIENDGQSFVCDGPPDRDAWLRYRHLIPSHADWLLIDNSHQLPSGVADRPGQLITDFYAYNAGHSIGQTVPPDQYTEYLVPGTYDPARYNPQTPGPGEPPTAAELGQHWVDDIAVECLADVLGNQGELLLDLVRAGVHHQCRINLVDGKATLSRIGPDGKPEEFLGDDGKHVTKVSAQTSVKGRGSYRLRLSNCDHQVLLWVNGSVVKFDGPTEYESGELVTPHWSPNDPGDLAPAGIGSRGASVKLSSLRVLRDKYYIAGITGQPEETDYRVSIEIAGDTEYGQSNAERIQRIFADPALWERSNLFAEGTRRFVQFQLGPDQFLPMGDNSPQSYDGRFWSDKYTGEPHHFVERDLLIGKALLIYWPHTWNRPIPFQPNFSRMGRIR